MDESGKPYLVVDIYYIHDEKWFCDRADYLENPTEGGDIDEAFIAWRPMPEPYQGEK